MVASYELDRVVKICVFLVSTVIFSVVPINFLRMAIGLVKYWVTVSSGDGREAVRCGSSWVPPRFVEALSSWSLSASHISTWASILSMSGSSSSQHPRYDSAIALLALSWQSTCRACRATE